MGKARLFSQLISGNGTIKADKLGDDVSTIEQASSTSDLTASGNAVGDQRVVGNNLYIWNGSGWFRIALINATPTWDSGGQPDASFTLDADSPQDATVITLSASDPDGFPITFSHVTGGSMDSMATISQDSSVFTVTPKSLVQMGNNAGPHTGTITFRASDGVNILPQVSTFTLTFITTVTNSNFTTLLLSTDNQAGSNQSITDSSSTGHTITVNGDTYAGSFSPYRVGGYVSHYNTGTTYVASSSDYNIGDVGFTIECWVKADTAGQGTALLAGRENHYWFSSGYSAIGSATGKFGFGGYFGNSWAKVPALANYVAGQWYFLRGTYNGSQIEFFIDGVSQGTASASNPSTQGSKPFSVGGYYSGSSHFVGKIDDIHVSNVVRSGAVPTARGVTADGNTLLIFQSSPYLKAQKGSLATLQDITYTGTVISSPDSIFDHAPYSEATHGGSVFFDGSGDGLTIPNHTSHQFGTNDFTVEFFVYFNNLSDVTLLGRSNSGQTVDLFIQYKPSSSNDLLVNTSTSYSPHTFSWTPVASTWYHVAVTRSGSDLKAYVNGVQIGTTANDSNSISLQRSLGIGYNINNNGQYLDGYMADVRLVKGTAVYSGAFTPPSGPLTNTGGTYPSTTNVNTSITSDHTSLLASFTDAHVLDKSQTSNLKLFGTAVSTSALSASSTPPRIGSNWNNTSAISFDGNSDYVIPNNVSDLPGNFTIETWMYVNSVAASGALFDSRPLSTNGQYISVFVRSADGKISMYVNSSHRIISDGTIPVQQWFHFAISRLSGTIKMYIDGTAQTTTYSNSNTILMPADRPLIGVRSYSLGDYYNGYIQDFRISNGLARYTASDESANIPTSPLEG